MIVKFCGFKTESDIKKIKKLEVDAVGFIHYPHSKRHVSLKQLKYLITNAIKIQICLVKK